MVQWLRPCLPMQGVWVQFLVRELRPHMPPGLKTQNIQKKKKKRRRKKKTLKKKLKNATKQNDSLGLGSSFLDPCSIL